MCIGKTFAETVSRFVVPAIVGKFDFTYLDETILTDKPIYHADALYNPEIMVKLKS